MGLLKEECEISFELNPKEVSQSYILKLLLLGLIEFQ